MRGPVRRAVRVLLQPAGWLLLAAGVVLFPLPGPGLLLLVAGLVVLAEQHPWAGRQLERARAAAGPGAVGTPRRTAVSVTATVALALAGLLWWWPGWSWLPGGPWAGAGQLVSGLAGLGLVLLERRRLRRDPR